MNGTFYIPGSSEDYQLYRQVWPIHHPHHTLATVGMTRLTGAALPVLEMQSRWVARVLSAGCTLPQHSHIEAWVKKRNAVLKTAKRRTVVSCVKLICNTVNSEKIASV